MKQVLKWAAIIIGCFILFVVGLLAGFYVRYKLQSPQIHTVVDGFFAGVVKGDLNDLKPYIDDRFTDQMQKLLQEHHADYFAHIASHSENKAYFSYHFQAGVGETTDYEGIVVFDDTSTSTVSIELLKGDQGWRVYGFKIGQDE